MSLVSIAAVDRSYQIAEAAEARLNDLGHLGDPDADLIERHAWLTRPEAGASSSMPIDL